MFERFFRHDSVKFWKNFYKEFNKENNFFHFLQTKLQTILNRKEKTAETLSRLSSAVKRPKFLQDFMRSWALLDLKAENFSENLIESLFIFLFNSIRNYEQKSQKIFFFSKNVLNFRISFN